MFFLPFYGTLDLNANLITGFMIGDFIGDIGPGMNRGLVYLQENIVLLYASQACGTVRINILQRDSWGQKAFA